MAMLNMLRIINVFKYNKQEFLKKLNYMLFKIAYII